MTAVFKGKNLKYLPLLTNGKVGWEVPDELRPIQGHGSNLAQRYLDGIYKPPKGWKVLADWNPAEWQRGVCGELRRRKKRYD